MFLHGEILLSFLSFVPSVKSKCAGYVFVPCGDALMAFLEFFLQRGYIFAQQCAHMSPFQHTPKLGQLLLK